MYRTGSVYHHRTVSGRCASSTRRSLQAMQRFGIPLSVPWWRWPTTLGYHPGTGFWLRAIANSCKFHEDAGKFSDVILAIKLHKLDTMVLTMGFQPLWNRDMRPLSMVFCNHSLYWNCTLPVVAVVCSLLGCASHRTPSLIGSWETTDISWFINHYNTHEHYSYIYHF